MKIELNDSATTITTELEWLSEAIQTRLKLYFDHECDHTNILEVVPPRITGGSAYATLVNENRLSTEERLVLCLSLAPYVKPQLLDFFFVKNATYDREFTEFGGTTKPPHKGFLPTGETALFLLSGDDIEGRLNYQRFFDKDHLFATKNLITLQATNEKSPFLSGLLTLQDHVLDLLTGCRRPKNQYNHAFPAQLITTSMQWEDLVLPNHTLQEIQEILTWLEHGDTLLHQWEMHKSIKAGYRVLFYGPPGTGKTLTATLLGQTTGKEVYRIDLSKVVSKYIGETEKNLANVFDQAENKNWILFFDEADALFGKRTSVNNSHDRYANQEVSYLLQRIEDYPGVVILASNMKGNLDEAFTRRFQAMIHFPMPKIRERQRIWENSFSKHSSLQNDIDLQSIAEQYELAGGSVMNVIRYSSLEALKRKSREIRLVDLETGIRKELLKEGRTK